MTARDRVRRADEIFDARARGVRWSTIATQHGITERTAQRAYANGLASRPNPLEREPLDLARELLEQYEAAIEELAILAQSTAHDGAKLGAIRSRIDVITAKTQLLMALGVLPQDIGELAAVVEADTTIKTIMRRNDVPPELLEEMIEALTPRRSTAH